MSSTQLDQFARVLPNVVQAAHHTSDPWYGSATLAFAVGAAGLIVGIVGVVVGVLAWRWSIRQIQHVKSTAQQMEAAVAEYEQRRARLLLLELPEQLGAIERNLAAAVEIASPADRAVAREALATLRTVAVDAIQYLDTADLTGLNDEDRGQFNVLLLLVDAALGDLHDASVAVTAATARVPIQLSSTTTTALRIAVKIRTAP